MVGSLNSSIIKTWIIPAVWSKAVIDFVPKAGLIASISGVATNFQWEINVVGSVAVYLYFIDIPQNLGLL